MKSTTGTINRLKVIDEYLKLKQEKHNKLLQCAQELDKEVLELKQTLEETRAKLEQKLNENDLFAKNLPGILATLLKNLSQQ